MDKIVVCPECGAQMTLQDGQVVFSCVDCGTRLYCIKGVVITKSQAKLLLKKLVEKKQAEKARQLEIERISAKNVNETVRPADADATRCARAGKNARARAKNQYRAAHCACTQTC